MCKRPIPPSQPLSSSKVVLPALDGYAIYGYSEPDGSKVEGRDQFNGHSTPELGYHYHATKSYPYLNGGFHGEVIERDGQVDPQPRAGGVREALPPLRGAKIIGFESKDNKSFSVKVAVGNETRFVNYFLNDNGSVKFDFVDGRGKVRSETIEWKNAPAGTKSFALSLWHTTPDQEKSYWLVYNIPASADHLDKNDKQTGSVGLNDKKKAAYSSELTLDKGSDNRAGFLKAVKEVTLAETSFDFQYERKK